MLTKFRKWKLKDTSHFEIKLLFCLLKTSLISQNEIVFPFVLRNKGKSVNARPCIYYFLFCNSSRCLGMRRNIDFFFQNVLYVYINRRECNNACIYIRSGHRKPTKVYTKVLCDPSSCIWCSSFLFSFLMYIFLNRTLSFFLFVSTDYIKHFCHEIFLLERWIFIYM